MSGDQARRAKARKVVGSAAWEAHLRARGLRGWSMPPEDPTYRPEGDEVPCTLYTREVYRKPYEEARGFLGALAFVEKYPGERSDRRKALFRHPTLPETLKAQEEARKAHHEMVMDGYRQWLEAHSERYEMPAYPRTPPSGGES